MAAIVPIIGHEMIVQLGNGATPTEVFTASASINKGRGFTITAETESDELVDATDQSLPAVTTRRTTSTDLKFDGSGIVHKTDLTTWLTYASSGAQKNVKFITATGAPTITVPMICTSVQVSGERKKFVEISVTLEAAGAFTIA